MIPATFQRSHPAECSSVGEYIPANVMPLWFRDRIHKFSPELHELKKPGALPEFDDGGSACAAKYTVWIFEPRLFSIGGDIVTMFVRVE
jgi:hypothetical protein